VHLQWLATAKRMGSHTSIIDFDGAGLTHTRMITGALLFSLEVEKRCTTEQNVGLLVPTSAGGIIINLACLMRGKTVVNLNYTASREALQQPLTM